RFRREQVSGFSSTDIQSYCVLCDLVPEGEGMVVLRRDNHTGNCEFWHALRGEPFYLPHSSSSGLGGFSFCPKRNSPSGGEALVKATASLPIRQVHLVFNSDNVWANLQSQNSASTNTGLKDVRFDLNNSRHWKPLFARGRDDLLHLSGLPADPPQYAGVSFDPAASYRLEDPSQALVY
ncbi:unnamed protein product, partial [Polarella glacialis]